MQSLKIEIFCKCVENKLVEEEEDQVSEKLGRFREKDGAGIPHRPSFNGKIKQR